MLISASRESLGMLHLGSYPFTSFMSFDA